MATGREYRTITNQVGFYTLPPSQPGEYRVVAESPGMEKWEGSLILQDSQTASVNPMLRVFLQDGVVLNSIDKGAVATRPPRIDAVQEFTVHNQEHTITG